MAVSLSYEGLFCLFRLLCRICVTYSEKTEQTGGLDRPGMVAWMVKSVCSLRMSVSVFFLVTKDIWFRQTLGWM